MFGSRGDERLADSREVMLAISILSNMSPFHWTESTGCIFSSKHNRDHRMAAPVLVRRAQHPLEYRCTFIKNSTFPFEPRGLRRLAVSPPPQIRNNPQRASTSEQSRHSMLPTVLPTGISREHPSAGKRGAKGYTAKRKRGDGDDSENHHDVRSSTSEEEIRKIRVMRVVSSVAFRTK